MADDFDLKYKRQEAGITDKKTGKTIPPFDKATQTLKKVARASTIGKAVAIPIALGAAAFEYAKGKRKEKKESSSITDMTSPEEARQKLLLKGYDDDAISEMQGDQEGSLAPYTKGMAEGGSVRGQKAIQVKKKPFKGIF